MRAFVILFGMALMSGVGCGSEMEMADSVDMPDSMEVKRALESREHRDAMLDTMPGGEMARGDSAAEMDLLGGKR